MVEFPVRQQRYRHRGDPIGPDGWINRRWIIVSSATGCLRWQGPLRGRTAIINSKRHGYINVRRLMILEECGLSPPRLGQILPMCGDVECVRPDHMRWRGKEAAADRDAAG